MFSATHICATLSIICFRHASRAAVMTVHVMQAVCREPATTAHLPTGETRFRTSTMRLPTSSTPAMHLQRIRMPMQRSQHPAKRQHLHRRRRWSKVLRPEFFHRVKYNIVIVLKLRTFDDVAFRSVLYKFLMSLFTACDNYTTYCCCCFFYFAVR